MREIKFRAWDSKYKTYVTWDEISKSRMLGSLVNNNNRNSSNCVLQQYTGLKDKNDKEIYEGDIISYGCFALNDTFQFGEDPWKNLPDGIKQDDITTEIERFQVKFEIDKLCYIKHFIEQNPDVMGVEIIGNIHENPGLLDEVL